MIRVLITEKFHPILKNSFNDIGWQVDEFYNIDTKGVAEIIKDYHILIVNSKIKCDTKLLENAKNLLAIGRVGAGMEIIDLEYCTKKNIAVVSAPEGNRNAVAEHALGMMLALSNNFSNAQNSILDNKWLREENRGTELNGKVIGIIGYGHTGSTLAKRLSGFDAEVLAYDILPKKALSPNVRLTQMDEIFERAQIVSIHLPLNPNTIYLANSNWFSKFKNPIGFINTSRGKIVKTIDLINEIDTKKVLWAGLDVFEYEPFRPSSKIKELVYEGKILLTPHIAGWTQESFYLLSKTIVEKIVEKIPTN